MNQKGKTSKEFILQVQNLTGLILTRQYIQEGRRNIFGTVIKVGKPNEEVTIPETEEDLDGLGYFIR